MRGHFISAQTCTQGCKAFVSLIERVMQVQIGEFLSEIGQNGGAKVLVKKVVKTFRRF
jgi:hypothetical protein